MESKISLSEEDSLLQNEETDKEERCSSCLRFPKAVYFIVIIELCERFNYYGMRTILILYLTQHLMISGNESMTLYHLFVCLCYISTIIGSFMSDNYWGKYKTLVIISVLYCVGSALMSLTSIPPKNMSGPIISLLLIALGTGGVKACVAPFGGDQIPVNKKVLLDSFFSMFYFAINLGSLISTILTPILRAKVACNKSDDCYPLAFGVPAILMGVALVILLIGQKFYIQVPVSESIYIRAARCIALAIKVWFRERRVNPREKLLDYAREQYDEAFIRDLRIIYHIAILYLPLPIYWALFEQMGSSWTLQAAKLDGEISSGFTILPDQMSIFNVILIMAFIPLFDGCIYPLTYKINHQLRPLRRMVLGMAITSLAFLAAFILQTRIDALVPQKLMPSNSRLMFVNGLPCDSTLYTASGRSIAASSFQAPSKYYDLPSGSQQIQLQFSNCNGIQNPPNVSQAVMLSFSQVNFLVADLDKSGKVIIQTIQDFQVPNKKGHPLIRLASAASKLEQFRFQLKDAFSGKSEKSFTVLNNRSIFLSNWETLQSSGRYIWNYKAPTDPKSNKTIKWNGVLISKDNAYQVDPIRIRSSEVTIFYMTFSDTTKSVISIPLIMHNGSQISMMWQIPQYILISTGEILFSITGLSFSYDQAPQSMKSLVNAIWFITIAVGNIMVMIVANSNITKKQSWEYLIYAVLCMLFNIVFAILAYFYQMVKNEDYIVMKEIFPEKVE